MTVRFKEKDATVRYRPGKVTLDQILKRYEDTPFDVSPIDPIVTIARTKQAIVRSWTQRSKQPVPIPASPAANKKASKKKANNSKKGNKKNPKTRDTFKPIQLFVEVVPEHARGTRRRGTTVSGHAPPAEALSPPRGLRLRTRPPPVHRAICDGR